MHRVHEWVQEDSSSIVDRTTLRELESETRRQTQSDATAGDAARGRSSLAPMLISQARGALTDAAGRVTQTARLSMDLHWLAGKIGQDMQRFQAKARAQLTALKGSTGLQQPVIGDAMTAPLRLQCELEALVTFYRQSAVRAETIAIAALAPSTAGTPPAGPGTAAPASTPLIEAILDSGELKALKIAATAKWSKAHRKALRTKTISAFTHVLEQTDVVRLKVTSVQQPHPADMADIIDRLRTLADQMQSEVQALRAPERPRGFFSWFGK